jgi:phosphoribosylformylglycinamidine synthase
MSTALPRAVILSGHGLNCEDETAEAFAVAGARPEIVHVDDLAAAPWKLDDAQLAAVPGGFSYGDDFGAGVALGARLRVKLGDHLARFVARGGLLAGLCNGCQVLVALGLVGHGRDSVTVAPNAVGSYQCRWVTLKVAAPHSPWLAGIDTLHVPVAHGEGQFVLAPGEVARLSADGMVAVRYTGPDGAPAAGAFPANPNGSPDDIAGITDATGRVIAMMPHPERALRFHHRPDWTAIADELRRAGRPIPEWGDGLQVFRNAVRAVS